jgi:hypothetical protein
MATKLALIPMKTRIADIQSIYASAAERIIAALSSLDPASYTAVKSGAVLSQVSHIVRSLDAAVQMWAPSAIRAAYQESSGVARTRLEMLGATALPMSKYNPARHDKKIAALTKTVMRDYWKANRTIEKTAGKYLAVLSHAKKKLDGYREDAAIQAFSSAEIKKYLDKFLENAAAEHIPSQGVARSIMDQLMALLDGEDFIEINGRSFNLKDYSELVARTRMREAQTEATIEMGKQFDNDLAQITTHDNPCQTCEEYQGNVYSISGETEGYDELPDGGPPWHPNCGCTMNLTSENALALRNA